MITSTYTSYSASPYWRWWNYYNSVYIHQLLPMRENHDTLTKIQKSF